MGWPQITFIALLAFGLIVTACLDGQPRTGNYSFAIKLCDVGITAWLLWMGGFFK